jgi:hypothetical protein
MVSCIRFFTPPVTDEEGRSLAGGLLAIGELQLRFLVDLEYWSVGAYQDQWRAGIVRLVGGAPSTALMTAYRGPGDQPHLLWALWREESDVFIQAHTVLPAELDAPFDPRSPYEQIGKRVAVSAVGLPIPEWRADLVRLLAAAFGIRSPHFPI